MNGRLPPSLLFIDNITGNSRMFKQDFDIYFTASAKN